MEKLKQTIITVALWIFVGFCLILAIGMPFGVGTILMIFAAVMAAPLASVRKVWNAVLDKLPQQKKKLFESKKKQSENRKINAKTTKCLIIALVFLFGFVFGMAATEAPESIDQNEPVHTAELPSETSEPTAGPSVAPSIEPTPELTPNPTAETIANVTPHEAINLFHQKMLTAYENDLPELTMGKYDNIWGYDFGDFTLQAYVNVMTPDTTVLNLEMSATAETNEHFIECSRRVFETLLGTLSDESYSELLTYAKDSLSMYSMSDFGGSLAPITGIMYYERASTENTTQFTIKAVYDSAIIADETPHSSPTIPQPTTPVSVDSSFSIHFIDVGQADAALVECDGHYMLIDGGNKADSNVIYSVLKKAGVPKLDIVVATHAHEDHVGGLPGAFNCTTADITLCPGTSYDSDAFEDFARYAEQNGGGITVPSVGDTYSLGSAQIVILGVNGGSGTNDTSIVLKIQYGQTSFLFTGDAEREAEQAILNTGADLSATVLKVGHHGSDTSTTYPFLREIMPQYAVISVGSDNSYGHPTDDTLSRLRDADVTVFRTDMQGDICCISDGTSVSFSVSRNAGVNTLESVTETPEPTVETTPEPSEEPTGELYIANTNTLKFHYPHCSSADDINPSNRWEYTGIREDLISMGYVPCKRCNP